MIGLANPLARISKPFMTHDIIDNQHEKRILSTDACSQYFQVKRIQRFVDFFTTSAILPG